ncbi:aminotransferase-like domain-containing protein [Scatolibacter rhodanostii]|uniref:aminotransferase-like domain-containing protein n=1 Tax=Scatolibacter rhodanostii TaxID=2014781 RepID=UPI000C07021B|nr:PLP-dependent aminotransferase family protein [Scatolibacter rhodanostii]
MKYSFSDRVQNLKPSAIREIFKYSANPEYIALSAGNPAPDAFPVEAIAEISQKLLIESPISVLQYGTTEGYLPLRNFLISYLGERLLYKQKDSLLITSGAQQAMDLLTKSVLNKNDVVLCEAPSFIGSLNSFRSFQANLVGVEVESDGVNIDKLEAALQTHKNIKYFYTIPNFQNPSGVTMSLAKRKKVYELCRQYGVLILEDNPYGDLRFAGEEVPAIKTFDEDGIVVYVGSFSKVIAPGIRVGYVAAPEELVSKMVVCKQGEDVHTNMWGQIVCHEFMTKYDFSAHIKNLQQIYRRKAQILTDAMEKYLRPKQIKWNAIEGGLFAWCTLPEQIDMYEYIQKALAEKVCVVPGTAFLTDENQPCSSFRINFSTPTDEQLLLGIERLGSLL